MYRTPCVNCQNPLEFSDRDAGHLIQCDSCGQFFPLPDVPGAVAVMDGTLRQLSPQTAASESEPARGNRRWWLLAAVVPAGGLAAVLLGNLAGLPAMALLALCTWQGYRLGAARLLAVLAAASLAILLAGPLGGIAEGAWGWFSESSSLGNRLVAMVLVGGAVFVAGLAGLLRLAGRGLAARPHWRPADRWGGLLLGGGQGAVLLLLAAWGLLCLEGAARGRLVADRQAGRSDPSARSVVALADSVRGSLFGRVAERHNPLAELRVFKLPGKFLQVVNHPQALAAFVEHPAVQELKERPAVAEALETLAEDPHVKQLIESGRGLDGRDLAAILRSPAALKLVDDSALLADLKPISLELERALDDAAELAARHPEETIGRMPPAGEGFSYLIHPPIEPWELTAVRQAEASDAEAPAEQAQGERQRRSRGDRDRVRRANEPAAGPDFLGH